MPEQSQNPMQCLEFDALMAEALDENLSGPKLEIFQAHADTCPNCARLFGEVRDGRRWLKSLEEVEPPVALTHNILAATSGVETGTVPAAQKSASWWEKFKAEYVQPVVAVSRQPRFAMSFGMAFFTLSIGLNLVGVKVSDLRHVDLRPSAIRHGYYEASGKVRKYYDNIRFVYELESRVQQFKRATESAEPQQKPEEQQKQDQKKDNNSGEPEQRQERNFSQGESRFVVALFQDDPPGVTVTTYRRLV